MQPCHTRALVEELDCNQTWNWTLCEVPSIVKHEIRVEMGYSWHLGDLSTFKTKQSRATCNSTTVNGVVHQIVHAHHLLQTANVLIQLFMWNNCLI